jgi:hypothetical protein
VSAHCELPTTTLLWPVIRVLEAAELDVPP